MHVLWSPVITHANPLFVNPLTCNISSLSSPSFGELFSVKYTWWQPFENAGENNTDPDPEALETENDPQRIWNPPLKLTWPVAELFTDEIADIPLPLTVIVVPEALVDIPPEPTIAKLLKELDAFAVPELVLTEINLLMLLLVAAVMRPCEFTVILGAVYEPAPTPLLGKVTVTVEPEPEVVKPPPPTIDNADGDPGLIEPLLVLIVVHLLTLPVAAAVI